MKEMIKNTLILFAITVIAGALLGVIYDITKEPIAGQEEKKIYEANKEVFEAGENFTQIEVINQAMLDNGDMEAESIDAVYEVSNQAGEKLGYVITVTSKEGYSGDIQFSMGITLDGTLNGISFLAISETPGLGMKAESVLKPQFAGKKAEAFVYTKSGADTENEIDAISGATITTNAVTNGVNAGLEYFRQQLTEGGNPDE